MSGLVVREKWKFRRIKKYLGIVNLIGGSPIYEPPESNKHWRLYSKILYGSMGYFLVDAFYSLTTGGYENFLKTSTKVIIFSTTIGCFFIITVMKLTKTHGATLLNWMATLPDKQSYFLHRTFNDTFDKANDRFLFLVKFITPTVMSEFVAVIFIQTLYNIFFGDETYLLPFRFELSFLPANNFLFYLINLLFHAVVEWAQACYVLLIATFMMAVFIHVIVYFEAIKVLIGNMEEGIRVGDFQKWLRVVSIEVRNAKEHFDIFSSEIILYFCYLLEKIIYGSFVLFWLAIKVEPGLLPWAVAALEVLVCSFVVTILNEVVMDKLKDLSETLYDQPWYELPPGQRRLLVPLMVDLQRTISLTTGLQDVTLDWYARIIKAAYSMGLVMEEFIKN